MSALAECIADTWYFPQTELLKRPPVTGIAIDSPDPKEIDDAVKVDWNDGDGIYQVEVHIADCGIIDPYSLVARNARQRSWSRYSKKAEATREDAGAMLPQSLHRGLLSLDADRDGSGVPTVTVSFDFDPQPEGQGIFNLQVLSTRIVSCLSVNYEQFNSLLNGRDEQAERIAKAAEALSAYLGIRPKTPHHHTAQHSIEMLMVTTNYKVSQEALKLDWPWIYRNQVKRPPKIEPGSKGINDPSTEGKLPASAYPITSFSTRPTGHESLRLDTYGGFTSPLRKWSDLVNHLTHSAIRNGDRLPYDTVKLDQIAAELTKKQRDRRIGMQAMKPYLNSHS